MTQLTPTNQPPTNHHPNQKKESSSGEVMTMTKKSNRKRPKPLAPPSAMKSRKKARIITTQFHKYTREHDLAKERGDFKSAQHFQHLLNEMGGREEYQRASQLSTSFHSTSKWVLGHLARSGWIHGIPIPAAQNNNDNSEKKDRRNLRLLEVGAINTELLDAAAQTKSMQQSTGEAKVTYKYRLHVTAIDLNSMYPAIKNADFLTFPLAHPEFDVVVCSMVINCVTKPEKRGLMLARLYHQLRPEGLCFLTLPKLCLTLSPTTTMHSFKEMLSDGGAGFRIVQTKESPKVAFFILQRPPDSNKRKPFNQKWTKTSILNKGKKFRNTFAVTLNEAEVHGKFD